MGLALSGVEVGDDPRLVVLYYAKRRP